MNSPVERLGCIYVGIAELVQHLLSKQGIAGSIPVTDSKTCWKRPSDGPE